MLFDAHFTLSEALCLHADFSWKHFEQRTT